MSDSINGKEFKVRVSTRRWGHKDTYFITKTEDGWYFRCLLVPNSGECNTKLEPYFFKALDHDSVNYPSDLPDYFDYLWRWVDENNVTTEEFESELNRLVDWINVVEENSPKSIFIHFK